ncbi:MAG: ABC transporter permease [Armatimonadota bacterium]|nr:ABC transporter permease [Armatimonadota bacterium]
MSIAVYSPEYHPRIWSQLRDAFTRRELLFALVQRDLKVRYKQTVLGVLWAVLPPLLLMVVFNVFLGRSGRVTSQGLPYPVFAYSGLLLWNYFSTVMSQATTSIVSHQSVVSKVAFPREILPWVPILGSGVDFLVASTIFAGLLAYYGVSVSWTALLAVPLLVIFVIFMGGLALLFAAFNTYFRDVRYFVPLMLQVWMFASPVVYSTRDVPEWLQPYYVVINPVAIIIDTYRQAVLWRTVPDPKVMVGLLVGAMAVFVFCYRVFKRAERRFADVI